MFNKMPNRYRNGRKHHITSNSSYSDSKYYRRYHQNDHRPERNYHPINQDFDTVVKSINRYLTTNSLASGQLSSMPYRTIRKHNRRPAFWNYQQKNSEINQTGWWCVSIEQAGAIGKERAMSTLKVHCPRYFQPYHVNVFSIL